MKHCDRCGNEANFFWRVSVNGRTKEVALCSSCAACERGADELGVFDEPFFPSTLYSRPRRAEERTAQSVQTPEKEPEKSLATHKANLNRALRREDYLTAARLRDQIRLLEGKTDEQTVL